MRDIFHVKKGDRNKAIADFTEAIRLRPQYYLSYDHRGNVYSDEGINDKALADYNKSIRLNPGRFGGYNDRAILYNATGQWDKALDDYNAALRVDPQNPTIFYIVPAFMVRKETTTRISPIITRHSTQTKNT